ncbi:unnamed protein product [Sordaria macrospora k-hell]|uniref:WGS project CABT00000000 data, contig 2.123 n=1 Tax=Sordaria macrospora (strain ATCC MYA-333 / DSM 997 / K(L3346) / K-hell) TaxID=771870 RepID=F7WCD7_SORMK|nr:uncharacterized protein SMAC_09533 [Sordaria macrospora k-hell]KAH7630147.1 hypothetical protein B0T09DRAFT_265142 [Sordaria sp. MPI-SDFR-AT-0083]CCC05598.1 unnamed protein product [Sordaria macrospora k-hell]
MRERYEGKKLIVARDKLDLPVEMIVVRKRSRSSKRRRVELYSSNRPAGDTISPTRVPVPPQPPPGRAI